MRTVSFGRWRGTGRMATLGLERRLSSWRLEEAYSVVEAWRAEEGARVREASPPNYIAAIMGNHTCLLG